MSILTPPEDSAGKNFKTLRPRFTPFCTSEAVQTPGVTGTPFFWHHLTVSSSKPGDTMNFAPALTALSAVSGLRTVPAPTIISGKAVLILLIASSAASVLNVTSAQGMPPFTIASASFSAFEASSIFTTGTIPRLWKNSKISDSVMYLTSQKNYSTVKPT